jgi:hypothetical protein
LPKDATLWIYWNQGMILTGERHAGKELWFFSITREGVMIWNDQEEAPLFVVGRQEALYHRVMFDVEGL